MDWSRTVHSGGTATFVPVYMYIILSEKVGKFLVN
jgi:hypothetical protein